MPPKSKSTAKTAAAKKTPGQRQLLDWSGGPGDFETYRCIARGATACHVCAITPTSCHVPDLWQSMCSPDQNPGAGTGTEAEKPGSSGGSSVYVTGHCSAQSKRFHHLELAPSFVACSRPGAAVISIPHHRAPTSQARSQMRRSSRRRRTTRRCAMTRISSLS